MDASIRTVAGDRFTDAILTAWDSRDPWGDSASGLSEEDRGALGALCDETGESYDEVEAEVLAYIRAKVS